MLYPLIFHENFVETVWGGHRLRSMKGLPSDGRSVGESWEVSAVKGRESFVANGPLEGTNLARLTHDYGPMLLGKRVYSLYGSSFPLLIKFIDAEKDLSIQVHPGNELAQARHQSLGKTEMWFVMQASADAHLFSGFKSPISKYEYRKRIEDGSITEVLQRHEVKVGDVFYIPAGRVHAICGGVMVAEVQQSSDITYRIFDYNRPGLDGKPRQLHVELAEDAIDYTVHESYRTDYEQLLNKPVGVTECPFFTVKILKINRAFHRKLFKYDSFIVYMCLKGVCHVRVRSVIGGKEDELPVRQVRLTEGNSCLIPACCADVDVVPDNLTGESKVLEVYIDNKNYK